MDLSCPGNQFVKSAIYQTIHLQLSFIAVNPMPVIVMT